MDEEAEDYPSGTSTGISHNCRNAKDYSVDIAEDFSNHTKGATMLSIPDEPDFTQLIHTSNVEKPDSESEDEIVRQSPEPSSQNRVYNSRSASLTTDPEYILWQNTYNQKQEIARSLRKENRLLRSRIRSLNKILNMLNREYKRKLREIEDASNILKRCKTV